MKVLLHEWVTGGGMAGLELPHSWAAEGRAMRRSVEADFRVVEGVEVITTVDERFGREASEADAVIVGPGQEQVVLARLARECDYTLVIAPEAGGLLEARASLIARAGGRSLGSTPSAIALTGDKYRLNAHLVERGVRTVPTTPIHGSTELPRDFPYPAVVKPRDGAGSLHTYYIEGPDANPFARDLPPNLVIQPYCRGVPMSATFLVGPSGTIRLIGVGRQRIEIVAGVFHYRGGRLPESADGALGAPLEAIRSVDGLRGAVGVDFVRDPETAATTVIEINPRPTTSYVGLVRLLPPGAIARAWLDLFGALKSSDDLRGMIDPRPGRSVEFLADGRILS
jgi:tyramine---L-glutamate ligase